MSKKTPPSLRTQIIDSIIAYDNGVAWRMDSPEVLFDKAIMPVLQKAMDAGDLLLGRNTGERIPVHVAVVKWLEQVKEHVDMVRTKEAEISRRQYIKMIYQFGESAERALNDINRG